uniref:SbcC/MukB-like Walker B domain-containing protein n=1 Tax=Actinotalea sp. C106 TaxID=2908644 RepID=UPI002540FFB4
PLQDVDRGEDPQVPDRLEQAVTEAAAAAPAAVEKAARTQQARIAGIAGELARGLETGAPCAVCGSTEHPAPAPLDPEHVTPEAVEVAEAGRLAAQQDLEAASTARSQAREQLGARTAAAEGLDVEQAQAALDAVRSEVATAQAATDRTVLLERQLQEHDGETRRLEAHVHELGTQIATHAAEVASLTSQITADETEVHAAREGAPTVRDRVSALDGRIRTVTAWIDALGEVEDRLTQEADRTDELSTGLAEHGFGDADAARAAHLPATELAALDAAVAQHRSALERVTAGLAEPEVRELPEQLEIDLDTLLADHEVADTAATQAAAEAARLEDRAASTARALAELVRAVDSYREIALEAEPVIRMANLASANGGDNAKRLTLGVFVLMRRFEDVVAAANARLVSMSSGRFELVRSDEREAVRATRIGLAMKVIDHRTETERDPRTLSGGETFYVSLCLALGLADVVTAEAGGIDLGTLFVDEGFGSLDPETLDVVLAELGRLRDGGRIVGVVSHVEQLKQSIAERIEVRRLPSGASTLTVRC